MLTTHPTYQRVLTEHLQPATVGHQLTNGKAVNGNNNLLEGSVSPQSYKKNEWVRWTSDSLGVQPGWFSGATIKRGKSWSMMWTGFLLYYLCVIVGVNETFKSAAVNSLTWETTVSSGSNKWVFLMSVCLCVCWQVAPFLYINVDNDHVLLQMLYKDSARFKQMFIWSFYEWNVYLKERIMCQKKKTCCQESLFF